MFYYTQNPRIGQFDLCTFLGPGDIIESKMTAQRLKDRRRALHYTQKDIERLTGIDQSNYSKLEQGIRYLSFDQAKALALALETSMDYLAGLTDNPKPYPRSQSK